VFYELDLIQIIATFHGLYYEPVWIDLFELFY